MRLRDPYMPSSREDVSQERKVRLVLLSSRQLQAIEVGKRHADVLCLAALVWTHGDISISSTGESGIDARAEGGLPFFTVPASTISDVEGHHNTIALLQQRHPGSAFGDDAHVLVAEDQARLGGGATLVHVQI